MDRQPDKARHLECCAGGGEALSRAKQEPLEGSPEDAELSSGNGETAHLTLKFKQDSTVDVGTLVYVDADFASKATDRRSVSGALVFVATMLVVWISRRQKCVSQSTYEAEYLAMGDGVKEALFVNGMLQFLSLIHI